MVSWFILCGLSTRQRSFGKPIQSLCFLEIFENMPIVVSCSILKRCHYFVMKGGTIVNQCYFLNLYQIIWSFLVFRLRYQSWRILAWKMACILFEAVWNAEDIMCYLWHFPIKHIIFRSRAGCVSILIIIS